MSVFIFSNFRITDLRMPNHKDGMIFRIHGACDITKTLATRMGWELMHSESGILSGFHGADLDGELNLKSMTLIPNGDLKKSRVDDLPASIARDFKLKTRKGDGEEDDRESYVTFVITMPLTSVNRMVEYRMTVQNKDAQLKLAVVDDPQGNIFDDPQGDQVEPEFDKMKPTGPTLASASEIDGARKNREAAKKAGVPFN